MIDLLAGLESDMVCLIVACLFSVFVMLLSHNVSINLYFCDCWIVASMPCLLLLDCLG